MLLLSSHLFPLVNHPSSLSSHLFLTSLCTSQQSEESSPLTQNFINLHPALIKQASIHSGRKLLQTGDEEKWGGGGGEKVKTGGEGAIIYLQKKDS